MVRSSAPDALDSAFLQQQLGTLPPHPGLVVAFSGGPDSAALLHALTRLSPRPALRALHVDHGMDPESGTRADAARDLARSLGADCRVLRVRIEATGEGPEGAARKARYRALAAELAENEVLLTAHHADDQAETVLLRLLRGAGPAALAGMPALRRLPPGWLFRPLLPLTRAKLDAYLQRHPVHPVIDPTNAHTRFDRNYLRHRVIPHLAERWPRWRDSVLQSAQWAAEAADAQQRLAAADLHACLDPVTGTVDAASLAALDGARQRALLRQWCQAESIPVPPAVRLNELLKQIAHAAPDRIPEMRWADHALCLHAGRLHLGAGRPSSVPAWCVDWIPAQPLVLPHALGLLALEPHGGPLPPSLAGKITVGSRRPGDRLRLHAGRPRQPLKRLLQQAAVPAWQRNTIPCIRRDHELLAAGDRWLDAGLAADLDRLGMRLVWRRDPGPPAAAR